MQAPALDGKELLNRYNLELARARRAAYYSGWERALAREFSARMRAGHSDWTLSREVTPLSSGGELFLPDFTLRHRDGREALGEIVGFWTPDYLERKLRKVAAAGLTQLILMVYRGLAVGSTDRGDASIAGAGPTLWFADRPRIGDVLDAADAVAVRPRGWRNRTSVPITAAIGVIPTRL